MLTVLNREMTLGRLLDECFDCLDEKYEAYLVEMLQDRIDSGALAKSDSVQFVEMEESNLNDDGFLYDCNSLFPWLFVPDATYGIRVGGRIMGYVYKKVA